MATTNPVSGTTLYTYTAMLQTAVQDAQGNVTLSQYDPGGRLSQVQDVTGGTTTYQDDAAGNTTTLTSGSAAGAVQVETRGYDSWNRVLTDMITGQDTPAQTTLTAYDPAGRVVETQQPSGDVVYTLYDCTQECTDQPSEVDLGTSSSALRTVYQSYSYATASGLLLESYDADKRDHRPSYDGAGRLTQSLDALYQQAGTTTITTTTGYDPNGATLTQTVQTQQPSGAVETHTSAQAYNAAGWPTSSSNDTLTTSYGYDAAGQERTHTLLQSGSTPLTTVLDPQGRATAISENAGGTGPYTPSFAYNSNDLPLTITIPGGVQETGRYDGASRLTHVGATGPGSGSTALSSSYDYGYNPVGWTTALTSVVNGASSTQVITHNALGRLQAVTDSSGGSQSYLYDANGNITQTVSGGTTMGYLYQNNVAPNELVTVTTAGVATTYGYDSYGNTTGITSTGGSTSLGYDKQARLATVTLRTGTVISQSYTAAGQRAAYTVTVPGQPAQSVSMRFTYRGSGELGQAVVVSGTTSYTDTYVSDQSGTPLELLRVTAPSATPVRYFYMVDGRQNVVALTNITGTVVDRYTYDLWGQPSSTSETVPQPLRYAGYWYDQQLGWYWIGGRHYDPTLKRWLQPDSSQQDGVRTYVYVGDDLIDTYDPSGTACQLFVRGVARATVPCWLDPAGRLIYDVSGLNCIDQALFERLSPSARAGALVCSAVSLIKVEAVAKIGWAALKRLPRVGIALEAGGRWVGAGLVAGRDAVGGVLRGAKDAVGGVFGWIGDRLPWAAHGNSAATQSSVVDKLERYLLNPDHPVGGPKAMWFERALGYNQSNLQQLAKQIIFDESRATVTDVTKYGIKYNQTIEIIGANGKVIPVVFAWIRNTDGVVRLVTAIPTKL